MCLYVTYDVIYCYSFFKHAIMIRSSHLFRYQINAAMITKRSKTPMTDPMTAPTILGGGDVGLGPNINTVNK